MPGHTQPLGSVTLTCNPVSVQMATPQKPIPQNFKGALPSVILVNKAVAIKYPGLGRLGSKWRGGGL